MSLNLLDILKKEVTNQLADHAGSFLGESSDNVSSALGGIFPTLLGAVIDKGSEPSGAKGIMDMIGSFDGNMLEDIGGLFGGGENAVSGILDSGSGILDSLLGDNIGGVVNMLTKKSNMGAGSIGSLLKMAAPFLLGKIGKLISGKGVSGLMDLLAGQKSHVKSALPSGVGSLLGLSSFGDMLSGAKDGISDAGKASWKATSDVAGKTADTAVETASAGFGFIKWLLPLLVLGVLGYLLLTKGCQGTMDKVKETTSEVADATGDAVGAAGGLVKDGAEALGDAASAIGEAARGAFSAIDESAKAALDKITFAAGSAGEQMMDFIGGGEGNGTFRFKNLTFATGSAAIDEASSQEVDNIAAILKAYPGVNVRIDGHTDNTGEADRNAVLSQARAEAVKSRLMAQGIDEARLSAKGFGQDNPVASNDTQEGRDQNKRVEITVVTE